MPTSASCSPGHRPLPLQARRCRCTRRCGELAGLRSPGYLRAHHGPSGDRRQRRSAAVRGQRHGRRHAWAGAHSPARPSKPSPWRAIRRVASTLPSTAAGTRTAYERDREPELRTEQSPWEGPLAAQLVHSRDGLNWCRWRPQAGAYLPDHPAGHRLTSGAPDPVRTVPSPPRRRLRSTKLFFKSVAGEIESFTACDGYVAPWVAAGGDPARDETTRQDRASK